MPSKYNGVISKFVVGITKACIAGERAMIHSILDNRESIFPPLAELAESMVTARDMFKSFHEEELEAIVKPHSDYMASVDPFNDKEEMEKTKKATKK